MKTMLSAEQNRSICQHENIMHLQQKPEQTDAVPATKDLEKKYIIGEKETRREL